MAVGEGSLAAGEVARGGPVAAREEGKGWGRGGEEGAEEEGFRAPMKKTRGRGRPAQSSAGAPAPTVSLMLINISGVKSEYALRGSLLSSALRRSLRWSADARGAAIKRILAAAEAET